LEEVRFTKLSPTNQKIRRNIKYQWQLSFFANEDDAKHDRRGLFWFYIANANHKAVQTLPKDQVLGVT
jgi:hypothetical protein